MFRAVEERDGYLALEDHGLIGDGATAGLVGRSAAIDWLCVPRFDSEPLFCAILDRERGGTFAIRPEGLAEARQAYDGETGILVTEFGQGCLLGRPGPVAEFEAQIAAERTKLAAVPPTPLRRGLPVPFPITRRPLKAVGRALPKAAGTAS